MFNPETYNNLVAKLPELAVKYFENGALQHKTFGRLRVNKITNNYIYTSDCNKEGHNPIFALAGVTRLYFDNLPEEYANASEMVSNMKKEEQAYYDALRRQKEREFAERVKEYEKQQRIKTIITQPTNEYGREVTRDEWEAAIEASHYERHFGESRAVIRGDGRMYINAAAAITDFPDYAEYVKAYKSGRNPQKDGDKLYCACETGKKWAKYFWSYADEDAIKHWIKIHYEG